jgi:hypothetical protein
MHILITESGGELARLIIQHLRLDFLIIYPGTPLAIIFTELRKKGRMIRATGAALFISTLIS